MKKKKTKNKKGYYLSCWAVAQLTDAGQAQVCGTLPSADQVSTKEPPKYPQPSTWTAGSSG
jgi:hypothetical protein